MGKGRKTTKCCESTWIVPLSLLNNLTWYLLSLSSSPLRCSCGEACGNLCGWPEHAQTGPLWLSAPYWAAPTVPGFWWLLRPWKTFLETDQGCHHLCGMCSSWRREKSSHSTVYTPLCHVLSPLTLRSQPQGHFQGQSVRLIGSMLKPAPSYQAFHFSAVCTRKVEISSDIILEGEGRGWGWERGYVCVLIYCNLLFYYFSFKISNRELHV